MQVNRFFSRKQENFLANCRKAKNLDGTEGPRAALYRDFAALLEQTVGIKPVLWDERRTTIEAHQILNESNYHGKKRKNTVDAVAASLILEGYLDARRLRNKQEGM